MPERKLGIGYILDSVLGDYPHPEVNQSIKHTTCFGPVFLLFREALCPVTTERNDKCTIFILLIEHKSLSRQWLGE